MTAAFWYLPVAWSRHGFSLRIVVTVDSENKTRIVCQAILRNEKTESFSWCLQMIRELRDGLDPEVSLAYAKIISRSGVVYAIHGHDLNVSASAVNEREEVSIISFWVRV